MAAKCLPSGCHVLLKNDFVDFLFSRLQQVAARWLPEQVADWVVLFVLHDPSDGLDERIGASTKAFASASGRSNTMAMSISPPSFLIRAGLPVCIMGGIIHAGTKTVMNWTFHATCNSLGLKSGVMHLTWPSIIL